jgi:phytoene desaturase
LKSLLYWQNRAVQAIMSSDLLADGAACAGGCHSTDIAGTGISAPGNRAVIVGAGPGGLTAALLLASSGVDVTVLERHDRIGGRCSVWEADGYRFDIGPTFFLYPGILSDIFARCGFRLEDEVELTRLDPMYHLVFEEGGSIRATPDLDRLAEEIRAIAPVDAAGLPEMMAENRAKFAAFMPVLQRHFSGLKDYLSTDLIKSFPLLRPFRSVDRDLSRFFSDPRVRLAFSFQSKYLGMSPYKCPSLFTILSFMEYEYGVFHPRGGCGAVMEAIARCARRAGARILLNEPVTGIDFEGRRAVGVQTERNYFPADALVINADFAQAMTTLVPNRLRRRWTDQKLAKKRYSCSTFMMYLGVEGRFDDLAHHTIYLSKNYPENITDIESGDRLPSSPSLYVQNACVTDPDQAPDGHSTLYVLVPVSNLGGTIDWEVERPRFRRLVLERLGKLGLTDLDKRIRFEKILTPVEWRDNLDVYRGATFSLAHDFGQMLHKRPNNRFEDLDRVYLVGGGTQPGSGLPVIFQSALITSQLLSDDLELPVPAANGADIAQHTGRIP